MTSEACIKPNSFKTYNSKQEPNFTVGEKNYFAIALKSANTNRKTNLTPDDIKNLNLSQQNKLISRLNSENNIVTLGNIANSSLNSKEISGLLNKIYADYEKKGGDTQNMTIELCWCPNVELIRSEINKNPNFTNATIIEVGSKIPKITNQKTTGFALQVGKWGTITCDLETQPTFFESQNTFPENFKMYNRNLPEDVRGFHKLLSAHLEKNEKYLSIFNLSGKKDDVFSASIRSSSVGNNISKTPQPTNSSVISLQ